MLWYLDEEYGPCGCTTTCEMVRNNVACDLNVNSTEHCCSCKNGMVRDEESGQCVDVADCPCKPEGKIKKSSKPKILKSTETLFNFI